MVDRNLYACVCRWVLTSSRAGLCRLRSTSAWRAAPVLILSAASVMIAAPAASHSRHLPFLKWWTPQSAPIAEVITSEYEAHEPTNEARNRTFGGQVAVSADGRTLAVADMGYYGGSEWPWYGSGAVYVYGRINGQWLLEAKLEPTDARGYDFFGSDLALSADGRTLAVGSQYEGYDAPSQAAGPGSVFVFTRRGGVWSQQALLRATNPQDAAAFGRTVEINRAGNVLAVGAPYESGAVDGATLPLSGAVYVFRKLGGDWTPQAALQAPAPQSNDLFGLGVRLSDDGRTLAVLAGEQNAMTEDLTNGGWPNRNNTVYVFARSKGAWSVQMEIEGSVDAPMLGGDGYDVEGQTEGFDLSANGRTLAIASPYAAGADGGSGVIHLYERRGRFWAPSGEALIPSLADRASFGVRTTLSSDGATLLASADRNEGPYGRPYVVAFSRRGHRGWSETHVLESPAFPNYTTFGNSLSLSRSGMKLAIGAQRYTSEEASWGAVFVY